MLYSQEDSIRIAVCTLLAISSCVLYLRWNYRKNNDIFAPDIWIPASYLLFYFSAPTLLVIFGDRSFYLSSLTKWENLPKVTELNTIGLIGIYGGLYLFGRNKWLTKVLPDFSMNKREMTQFLILLLPVYFILFSSNYFAYLWRQGIDLGPYSERLNIFAGISCYFFGYLVEALYVLKWKKVFLFVVSLYFISAILFLSVGMRYRLLYMVLYLAVLIYYTKRNRSYRSLMRPGLKTWKRTKLLLLYIGSPVLILLIASYFKHIIYPESLGISNYYDSFSQIVLNLIFKLDYNSVLSYELLYYKGENFHYGLTFIKSIISTIAPDSIIGLDLGGSLQHLYQQKIQYDFYYGADLGVGLDYALNAEGYINFGTIGVPFIMFIVSATIKSFYVKYITNRTTIQGKYMLLSPYITLVASLDIFRREFSNFLNVAMAMLLVIFFLTWISKSIAKTI